MTARSPIEREQRRDIHAYAPLQAAPNQTTAAPSAVASALDRGWSPLEGRG